MTISVKPFFHDDSGTISYVLVDSASKYAAIIDSTLDFDIASGEVSATMADAQLTYVRDESLTIEWILETHAHADHLSAAHYLKSKTGAKTAIGRGIVNAQHHFSHLFGEQHNYREAPFDQLLGDGDVFKLGEDDISVLATPGHTNDSVSYLIDDNIFVGDTLFMPDSGTARCDFPGGDASKLWASIKRIHNLPDHTKIWVCHDYQPGGRKLQMQTTVAKSKQQNIHVNPKVNESDYVAMRNARDASLAIPRLLFPSLQVNLWGGHLPKPKANGVRYITIPIKYDSPTGDGA